MMEGAGLMVSGFESFGADALDANEPHSPKINVFHGSVSSLVWGFKLTRG
jgi:hypothetical protein